MNKLMICLAVLTGAVPAPSASAGSPIGPNPQTPGPVGMSVNPDAHCVLCDGDPGGGDGGWGGGGILSITEGWLDDNYPGWAFQSTVGCDQTDDGTECYTIIAWDGEWITPGCVLRSDGTHYCG